MFPKKISKRLNSNFFVMAEAFSLYFIVAIITSKLQWPWCSSKWQEFQINDSLLCSTHRIKGGVFQIKVTKVKF